MTRVVPAVVVGGYLGAGKTTLVNRLLRHAGGRRIAVLVNDFGDVPIDADLIESRDGDVLNLAGGCICCSVGSDLLGALLTLPGRITRLKGHEDFIRLIGALKAAGLPVHGLIIGGAAPDKRRYLDELARSVAAQGLAEDISFTGLRSDMREVFSQSDAVLALSTQPESFGRTTLEALALGVPVIGWDNGGVGEILARVFPAGGVDTGDLAQLEARVRQLLESGSRPGPIPDCFALDRMCAETLELYHALDEQCAVGGSSAKP